MIEVSFLLCNMVLIRTSVMKLMKMIYKCNLT